MAFDSEAKIRIVAQDDASRVFQATAAQAQALKNSVGSIGPVAGSSLGPLSNLKGGLSGVNVALGAVGLSSYAVVQGFREIVTQAADSQESIHSLKITLEGIGKGYDDIASKLETTVQRIHDSTRFDDEEVRAGLTNLIQLTGDVERSEKSLAAVADLAAARHVSFGEAANGVARAVEGQERALKSLGIIFDENERKLFALMTTGERFDYVAGKIEARYSGARLKDLETFNGQWAALKNTWGDLAENAGTPLLGTLTDLLKILNEIAKVGNEIDWKRWLTSGGTSLITDPTGEAIGFRGVAPTSAYLRSEIPRAFGIEPGAPLDSQYENLGPISPETQASIAAFNREQEEGKKKTKEWVSEWEKVRLAVVEFERNLRVATKAGADQNAIIYASRQRLSELHEKTQLFNVALTEEQRRILAVGNAMRDLNKIPFGEQFKDFATNVDELRDMPFGMTGDQWKKYVEESEALRARLREEQMARELAVELDNARKIAAFYEQEVRGPLSDAFSDAILSGGESLGSFLEAEFADVMRSAGGTLVDVLRDGLKGIFNLTPEVIRLANGTFQVGDQFFTNEQAANQYAQNQGNNAAGGYLDAGVQAAGAIYGAVQGRKQGAGAFSTIATTGMAGLSIGGALTKAGLAGSMAGPIGLMVGVIAGAIISILTDTVPMAVEKYAVPHISDGLASLSVTAGVQAQEEREWLQKIQESFERFKNAYVSIFLDLPDDIRDLVLPEVYKAVQDMTSGSFGALAGFGNQSGNPQFLGDGTAEDPYRANPDYDPNGGQAGSGNIGGRGPGNLLFPSWTPSDDPTKKTSPQEWQAWMNSWINNQLPQAEMEVFRPAFEKAFGFMGVTQEKFEEIWKRAEGMNPQKALEYLGLYSKVLAGFKEAFDFLEKPVNFGKAGGLWEELDTERTATFADELADANAAILELGDSLYLLTGTEQLMAAQELLGLEKEREEMIRAYIRDLISMIEGARQSLQQDLLGLQMVGKDPAEQYEILKGYLAEQQAAFGEADTAAEAQAAYEAIRATIKQMAALFPQDMEINAWAQGALRQAFDNYNLKLTGFGNAVDQSNADLAAGLDPIFAQFTTLMETAGVNFSAAADNVGILSESAGRASSAIDRMTASAEAFSGAMRNSGYVASVRSKRAA